MAKRINDIDRLQQELQDALTLIESTRGEGSTSLKQLPAELALSNADSLLERCKSVVNKSQHKKKPVLRIIYHLACSGGTVISKCLASQPNAYLLSEVHPISKKRLNRRVSFSPTDIAYLSYHAGIPLIDELSEEIFQSSISIANKHVMEQGGYLVLRYHAHSDYCYGKDIKNPSRPKSIFESNYIVKSICTIRDPVDSYLSLKVNKWIDFLPDSFDEYCRRIWFLINSTEPDLIILYEKFLQDPAATIRFMCETLEMSFSDDFQEIYDAFALTGDSGRNVGRLERRSRRRIDESLRDDILGSEWYKKLIESYGQYWEIIK